MILARASTFNMSRMADKTETFSTFISTKQAPHHDVTPSMLHEQNVNNLRYTYS